MGFFLSLAVFLVILIVILNLKRLIVKCLYFFFILFHFFILFLLIVTTLRKWDEKANPHGELEQILFAICFLLVFLYFILIFLINTDPESIVFNLHIMENFGLLLKFFYIVFIVFIISNRNMYVYPLMEGGLMIINPMVVRENVLNQILQLGEPKVCFYYF